jgi:hypothetical protein
MQKTSLGMAFLFSVVLIPLPMAIGQEVKEYDAFKTSSPPVIDGQFTEEEWGLAPNAGGWTNRGPAQTADIFDASFRAMWDEENFYLLMRSKMGGGLGATYNDEGRTDIPPGFVKTWNVYWDPNTDGEDNEDLPDAYQYAVSIPEGVSLIPSPGEGLNVADFREAHVDAPFGNQGGPWSMFTTDPKGGSDVDNFMLAQVASNSDPVDADGSLNIVEMSIPWENFNATDPADDPAREFGLFHPVAPELGETWFFTIALASEGDELPTWHTQSVGPEPGVCNQCFALRPHGLINFVESEVLPPWPGDVDGDGHTDVADLNIIGLNWRMSGKLKAEGDLTGDGMVDAADLNMLGINWQTWREGEPAAVPEPSGCVLILTSLVGLLALRRTN